MRFRILDREKVELSQSKVIDACSSGDLFSINTDNISSVIVLNKDLRILPLVSDWLTDELLSRHYSLETIELYAKNIRYFLDYLDSHALFKNHDLDSALLDIQKHTIEEYFVTLKEDRKLSSQTIRNRDATLLEFYCRYICAYRRGERIRDDNPYKDGFLSPSPKSKIIKLCSIDELVSLQECAHTESERVLLQFMFDTGVRRSEVVRVMKSHIDEAIKHSNTVIRFDSETVILPSEYKPLFIAGAKGRRREIKERYGLISVATLARVRRMLSSPNYRVKALQYGVESSVFLNSVYKPYSKKGISKVFEKLSERALAQGKINRKITPHMMRHGFAGQVLRSPDLGKNSLDRLIVIQKSLGHASLKSTQIYTQLPVEIFDRHIKPNDEPYTRNELMEKINQQTKKSMHRNDKS